ncbi:sigma-54-dependent Fis family transcriptional regulator [candidate division KSB1 bacterium]|nr:sigma-54-dependent Fis family transcriptional regulator [candidate division KSB1 bacterium]
MSAPNILIVDDEKNIRRSVAMICSGEGYETKTAADSEEALKMLDAGGIDLALLDIAMPGMDGLSLLKEIKKKSPETTAIMISGNATLQNAITATKEGAFDFIEKPITKEKLLISINNALQSSTLQKENIELKKQLTGKFEMVGESRAMKEILEQISKVAPTNGRVMITGESGTGKELIARAIHENSLRKNSAFIKVNCAAIPEELIESELFGSEKGAYTGAHQTREGKFSLADGGTLLLDEVGDMSLNAQAKVLRVLQEGEFEKVGGHKTQKVDVRVLAATNKDLEKEAQADRFRDDLYFRLNVVPINSPPLRRRKDDIPILVQSFIESYAGENGVRKKEVSSEAMEVLRGYDWPGNIREIKNMIERLMIMCSSDIIDVADLPDNIQSPTSKTAFNMESGMTLKEVKENVEREFIISTLKKNGWNVSQTAKDLDVDRTNLHKKIKYYGLSIKNYEL